MKIKKASNKYNKEIAELMIEEFSKPPFNEHVSFDSVIKSLDFYFKIGNILIAIEEDKIIGVLIFKVEQYWEGSVIIIEDLAVREKYKKQGIGKKLMVYVEDYAKNKKIKLILFKTYKNSPAIKFYKKIGYKHNKKIINFEKKIK